MPDFAAAPFHRDAEARTWVAATLARLTPREKIAQMFNVLIYGNSDEEIAALRALGPGSVARLETLEPEAERAFIAAFNAACPVPVLVTADLEGSFTAPRGTTPVPTPLGMAAANDPALTEAVSRLMAAEAAEVGINWSFTPLLDISAAPR